MQLKQLGVRANIIRYATYKPLTPVTIRFRKRMGFGVTYYHLMHPGKGSKAMRRARKLGLITAPAGRFLLCGKPVDKRKFGHLAPSLRRQWMIIYQQNEIDKRNALCPPLTQTCTAIANES